MLQKIVTEILNDQNYDKTSNAFYRTFEITLKHTID